MLLHLRFWHLLRLSHRILHVLLRLLSILFCILTLTFRILIFCFWSWLLLDCICLLWTSNRVLGSLRVGTSNLIWFRLRFSSSFRLWFLLQFIIRALYGIASLRSATLIQVCLLILWRNIRLRNMHWITLFIWQFL